MLQTLQMVQNKRIHILNLGFNSSWIIKSFEKTRPDRVYLVRKEKENEKAIIAEKEIKKFEDDFFRLDNIQNLLSDDEFEVMKQHTTAGRDVIIEAESVLKEPQPFLVFAREISYYHHEHWDGSGYPEGLAGEAIPFSARLMAVADVYDALVSCRVYKPAFSHQKAQTIIVEGRGSQFDPDIVDAFLEVEEQFQQVSQQYQDH